MKRLKPIESLILTIRASRVLIDADLAVIYGVETRALNQAVKRNSDDEEMRGTGVGTVGSGQ